jgi:uncharacterized membrane protein HdeD (DUF308 family)/predicted flap endonuclease-1-like 5' DNA nuclease
MATSEYSESSAVWGRVKLPPWWLVLIEGILLIIIGIMFFVRPYGTMVTVVWVLGLYWLIRGILDLISLIWDRSFWGWKIFAGILGIVAGWILLQQPLGGTLVLSTTLIWILAFIGLFIGISSLMRGFQGAGWGTIILGIVEIVISILLFTNAAGAASWLPWVLGGLAILGGILTIIASFGIRSVEHTVEDAREQAAQMAARANEAARMAAVATAAETAAAADAAAETVDDTAEDMSETVEDLGDRVADMVDEASVVQDLTVVEGIGPKTAEALQAAGINSLAELAMKSPDQIHAILKDAGLSADPSTWPEQAGMAAAGKMDELKEYQDKLQGGRE